MGDIVSIPVNTPPLHPTDIVLLHLTQSYQACPDTPGLCLSGFRKALSRKKKWTVHSLSGTTFSALATISRITPRLTFSLDNAWLIRSSKSIILLLLLTIKTAACLGIWATIYKQGSL
jgi:hypothetical protein